MGWRFWADGMTQQPACRPQLSVLVLVCLGLLCARLGHAQALIDTPDLLSRGAATHTIPMPAAPVLLELDERGRNLKLSLLDKERKRLATFDSPGRSLGKLVVLIEPDDYPDAHFVEISPRRESSSAGKFRLLISTPQLRVIPAVRILTTAARNYAEGSDRSATIDQFAKAATQGSPWTEWARYWAAVAENEYGTREAVLQRLGQLPKVVDGGVVDVLQIIVAARAHLYLGNLEASAVLLQQVAPVLASLAAKDPVAYTAALIGVREYQCAVRVYQHADVQVCTDALAAAQRLGDPYLIGLLSNNLAGDQLLHHERPEVALPYAKLAAEALESSGRLNYDVAANAYLTLARANERLGRYTQAQLAIQHAVSLQVQHDRKTNLGWAYNRAAELYGVTGDYARSAVYGENAVRLLRETGDQELAARAAVALAEVYGSRGMSELAMRHAMDALGFYQDRCGQLEAASRCSLIVDFRKAQMLAALMRVQGDPMPAEVEVARADAERALASIGGNTAGVQVTAELETLYADLLAQLGDSQSAQQRLESALAAYTRLDDAVGKVEVLARRAEIYYDAGEYAAANKAATAATDLLAAVEVQLTAERLGPALRAKLFDQFGLRVAALVAITDARPRDEHESAEAVFNIAVESLGPSNYLSRMPSDPVLDGLLTDLSLAITRRVTARESLGVSGKLTLGREDDAAVARAVDAVEAFFLRTGGSSPSAKQPIGLHELQSALATDEAVLHYVWWREQGWVVVIAAHSIQLHATGEIPAGVFADARTASSRQGGPGQRAWLSSRLLPELPANIDRLYVIPDGPIHVLPLGVLPLPDDTTAPVLTRYTISYLSSYDGFAEGTPSRTVDLRRGAAVLANPAFANLDTRVRGSSTSRQITGDEHQNTNWFEGLPPLRSAEAEARDIAEILQGAEIYLGVDANKDQLRSPGTKDKAIWHFATHGYFTSEFADITGIVLAQVDKRNRRRDGLFTIQDARAASTHADLVVLNGCETGMGTTLRGEGVMGFTRAFIGGGVANTISTVWKVPDRAAREIMVDFYKELVARNGADVAGALATAQRNFLKRNNRYRLQPIYWGGYIHHQL